MIKRILLVDDEIGLLDSYKVLLGGEGVEVDVASTPAEAELRIREHDYRAVVFDVRLGGRTDEGFRLLGYLKDTCPKTDTIMVTGYGCPENMEKAYRMGASFYFEKPVAIGSLKDALHSLGVGA